MLHLKIQSSYRGQKESTSSWSIVVYGLWIYYAVYLGLRVFNNVLDVQIFVIDSNLSAQSVSHVCHCGLSEFSQTPKYWECVLFFSDSSRSLRWKLWSLINFKLYVSQKWDLDYREHTGYKCGLWNWMELIVKRQFVIFCLLSVYSWSWGFNLKCILAYIVLQDTSLFPLVYNTQYKVGTCSTCACFEKKNVDNDIDNCSKNCHHLFFVYHLPLSQIKTPNQRLSICLRAFWSLCFITFKDNVATKNVSQELGKWHLGQKRYCFNEGVHCC